MLTFGGRLLFHSFHNWAAIQREGGKIETADFLADLSREANKISNFYLAHWGRPVGDFAFVASGLENEIKEMFKDKTVLFIPSEEAAPASGAAARSILGEKAINLLGTSSLRIFNQNRIIAFTALWRTTLIAVFGTFFLLSLGADLFLKQVAEKTEEVSVFTLNEPERQELLTLKDAARKFNELTSLIGDVRKANWEVGPVAERVNNLAGVEVKINRLHISSVDAPITISGVANNEQAAIAFKNRLAGEAGFTAVELPISGISPEADGRVSFTVRFLAAGSP